MPLPILEVKDTSTRILEAKNKAGVKILALVDAAQTIFPEQSSFISLNWERGYRLDGVGFKRVITHLDAVTCRDREPKQEVHLAKMRKYAKDIWH